MSGLENMVVAETVLSSVDGAAGRLIVRGREIGTVAASWTFEDVARLLFDGFFPERLDHDAFLTRLGEARVDTFRRCAPLIPMLLPAEPYDAVRAAVALLPDGDTLEDALRLVAAPAVLTPAVLRQRAGRAPVAPDPASSHAADVLRMLRDAPAPAGLERALDTYLVTVCDHGLNASTFAARIVASTRAGLTSSVLAGLSALKGPLHGGAPGPVIEMLDALAQAKDLRATLREAVSRGERLMGFGHRIYRVRDPRADALKAALRQLGIAAAPHDAGARLAFAEQVEAAALDVLRTAKPDRVLETNVEFYTALLLEAIGFPPASFSCVFAMSRVAGWIAHAREQQATGRLIRPQSRYVGPEPEPTPVE